MILVLLLDWMWSKVGTFRRCVRVKISEQLLFASLSAKDYV